MLNTALFHSQHYKERIKVLYNMTWIFGSFLVTLCALASCHILIRKQEDDSTIRALEYNSCVTRRWPRDENYAVRFRQSAVNCSRAWDTQPIRGVSACKGVASVGTPLAPGRRHGKKKSSLLVYVPPPISHTHTTETLTLSRIKCERYIFL